jgi:hypothetical protein
MTRRGVIVAFVSLLTCVGIVGASASWSGSASGSGKSKATTIAAGATPQLVSASSSAVTLKWTPTRVGTAEATSYNVGRYAATSGGSALATSSCAGGSSGGFVQCTITGVPAGTWFFGVSPVLLSWTGSEGARTSVVVPLDTTPPAQPSAPDLVASSDTGSSSTDNITKVALPTFVGTAEANTTIQLLDGSTQVGSGATDASGSYTATVATALSDGAHSITVKATDGASNQSVASSALSITVDTVAPTVASLAITGSDKTPSKNDTLSVAFSESLALTSICSTWGSDTSDPALTGSSLVLRVANNAAASGADLFKVQSTGTTDCAAASSFGSVDVGSANYVSADVDFSGSQPNASSIAWTARTKTLKFTLGEASTAASSVTVVTTATYTPGSAMTDVAGNAVSGTASATSSSPKYFF